MRRRDREALPAQLPETKEPLEQLDSAVFSDGWQPEESQAGKHESGGFAPTGNPESGGWTGEVCGF